MYTLKFTGDCDEPTFNAACDAQNFWYHSYHFSNGFRIRGDYNIGENIEEYGFPDDMTGMKVLDIGTGGGWFAFYFEQHGAEVTTVDARGYCDFDVRGRYEYPPVESEKPQPDRIGPGDEPIYDSPVSGGFWIMRDLLKSRVKFVNARVYDICPDLFDGQTFDLVFMGTILLHLRDPIGALMAARSVCADRLIAATPILHSDRDDADPVMMLCIHADAITWWYPNRSCYKHWFLGAGFASVNVERQVTLTADKIMPHPDFPVDRNISRVLQIGDAQVHKDLATETRSQEDSTQGSTVDTRLDKRIFQNAGDLLVRAGERLRNL